MGWLALFLLRSGDPYLCSPSLALAVDLKTSVG